MTVDKPPLALWVQAASAKVFGFSSLSMLVPQALMGVAAVGLVYDLTRRVWGRPAGFVAGLVLALTPISVAIARHNNPDMLLVLLCVAALWFVVRGLADGRTRWIVLAGVMIGLGFETKMAAALIVVPGLAAAWLWAAPGGGFARVRQLAAGGLAMVVVGGAWPLLVALTPAESRPWISGTADNSIWSLIAGYNGAGRVTGQAGGPGGAMGGPGGGGGGGGVFGGPIGPFRLLDSSLGAQAGWLLGFALVSGIAILVGSRLRRGDARTGWLIATGGAFLACAVVFSVAEGIFHPYYVSLLAPFTAALVGGGVGQFLRGDRSTLWLAPVAVVIGGVVELVVLNNTSGAPGWASTLIIVTGIAAVAAMVAESSKRIRMIALAVALAGLLAAPATWAAQTLGHATNGTFPAGGPASAGGFGGPGGGRMGGPGGAPGGTRATSARRTAPRRAGPRPAARRPGGSRRRRRPLRRQLRRPHRGARLRQGARRRHDRRVEPAGRGLGDHRVGRRRRRHRRLLRPRVGGQRRLAEAGGRRRPHPLGARRRPGRRHAAGRPHRLPDRHGLGPGQRHAGLRRPLRPQHLSGTSKDSS